MNNLPESHKVYVLVYLDDILFFTKGSDSEHREAGEAVLRILHEDGWHLNTEKCESFLDEVHFLGQVVNAEGVRAASSMAVRELRSFLVMVGRYRHFIDRFAEIVGPLHELTGNANSTSAVVWVAREDHVLYMLKQALVSAPILALPEPRNGRFDIPCDASKGAVGGVLTQLQSGIRRTIAYCSHKLTDQQTRYTDYDSELLALPRTLKQWAPIVLGSHVTVHTDHRTLTHVLHQRRLSSQQFKNLLYISYFYFYIKHIAGAKHVIADCLSRPPGQRETPEELFSFTITTAEDKGLDAWKARAQTLYPQDEWFGPLLRTIKRDSLEGLSAEQVVKASARA